MLTYVHVEVGDAIHILAGQHYLFYPLQHTCERWVMPHSHIRIQSGGFSPASHKHVIYILSSESYFYVATVPAHNKVVPMRCN